MILLLFGGIVQAQSTDSSSLMVPIIICVVVGILILIGLAAYLIKIRPRSAANVRTLSDLAHKSPKPLRQIQATKPIEIQTKGTGHIDDSQNSSSVMINPNAKSSLSSPESSTYNTPNTSNMKLPPSGNSVKNDSSFNATNKTSSINSAPTQTSSTAPNADSPTQSTISPKSAALSDFTSKSIKTANSTDTKSGKTVVSKSAAGKSMGRTTTMDTSGTTTGTQVSGQQELSLPGFLNFEHDVDYKLYKKIGSGSTASVWLTKIISNELKLRAGSSECVSKLMQNEKEEAFKQEVSIMSFFRSSPYFCTLVGYSTKPYVILMKAYPYGNLEAFLHTGEKHALSPVETASIPLEIAMALSDMHKAGFAHCDLKPANILLEKDANKQLHAVLSDFGISRVVQGLSLLVEAFTTIEIVAASVAYAAPEVVKTVYLKQKKTDYVAPYVIQAGDTYSFAITVYEIVTRVRPWLSVGDAKLVIKNVIAGKRPDIPETITTSTNPMIKGLLEIMEKCWLQDPLERPSMEQTVDLLKRLQVQ